LPYYIEELDSRVGRKFQNQPTFNHVLRPSWRNARDVAERWLPHFLASFNSTMKPINLVDHDVPAFLNFLDQQQLAVWHLEFAEVVGRTPSDTALDHRFVHLRSLALLVQPVIAALADKFGTQDDESKVRGATTQGPMSAFLATRDDWRKRVWCRVQSRWRLTRTTGGTQLEDRLQTIASLHLAGDYDGTVKTLLTLAALRNFGGHRFSNDPSLLMGHWPQLLNAVVFTPLFYWKVATDLG